MRRFVTCLTLGFFAVALPTGCSSSPADHPERAVVPEAGHPPGAGVQEAPEETGGEPEFHVRALPPREKGVADWTTRRATESGERRDVQRVAAENRRRLTTRQRASTGVDAGARLLGALTAGGGFLSGGPYGIGNGRDVYMETRVGTNPFTDQAKVVGAATSVDVKVTSPGGTLVGAPVIVVVDFIMPEPWVRLELPGEPGVVGVSSSFQFVVTGANDSIGSGGFITTVDLSGMPQVANAIGVVIQAGAVDVNAPNGLAIAAAINHWGTLPAAITTLTSTNMGSGSLFGESSDIADVDGDGNGDLVVGVSKATISGVTRAGAVVVLYGPTLTSSMTLKATTPTFDAEFGRDVTVADVTGDGNVDIIVGARNENVGSVSKAGSVYVFPGPSFTNPTRLTEPTPEVQARFGHALAVTDWNGDGMLDLAIGAHKATSGGGYRAGEAFIALAPDFTTKIPFAAPTSTGSSRFGYGLAGGDFDGDGKGDVAIGAPYQDVQSADDTGVVHVFISPSTTPSASIGQDADAQAFLGHELDVADFDQDGHLDIVAGAEFDDEAALNSGSVHVLYGPDWTRRHEITSPDPQDDGGFGSDVDVGDVNDDGYPDILIGEMWANPTGVHDLGGRGWVVFGPDFSVHLALAPGTIQQGDWTGRRMTCGDLDGDGAAETVLGAPFATTTSNYGGRLYIYN